jgi:hypothetical protein
MIRSASGMTTATAIFAALLVTAGSIPLASAAAPIAATSAARLQAMEDRVAIERLLVEYGRTLDKRDFAAYSTLFAANGEWKGALGTYKGPAAIQAAMEQIFTSAAALADIPKGKNFHVMSNVVIDVQGDRATASSLFIFYKMDKNAPVPAVAGRYEDTFIRENGVWKFLQRNALPPG